MCTYLSSHIVATISSLEQGASQVIISQLYRVLQIVSFESFTFRYQLPVAVRLTNIDFVEYGEWKYVFILPYYRLIIENKI